MGERTLQCAIRAQEKVQVLGGRKREWAAYLGLTPNTLASQAIFTSDMYLSVRRSLRGHPKAFFSGEGGACRVWTCRRSFLPPTGSAAPQLHTSICFPP